MLVSVMLRRRRSKLATPTALGLPGQAGLSALKHVTEAPKPGTGL